MFGELLSQTTKCNLSAPGSQVPEPRVVLTSARPSKVQGSQGLGPCLQMALSNAGRHDPPLASAV